MSDGQARYWQARPSKPSVGDDTATFDGYLPSPNLKWPTARSEAYLRLSQKTVRDTAFLLLVGDSGMGKSHELCAELQVLETIGEKASVVELDALSSLAELEQEVMRSLGPTNGSEPVHVFLDGLDESTLPIRAISKGVLKTVGRMEPELRARLRLRLACRSIVALELAELEDRFQELGSYQRLELLPLTREQAHSIADEALVNRGLKNRTAEFKAALSADPGLEPLAARPATLIMLTELFGDDTGLPAELVTLYKNGCRELARAPKGERPVVGVRLAIAKRIAAATVLCHRPTIHLELDGSSAVGDVSLADLLGATEPLPSGAPFEVTEPALLKVLKTGKLFTGSSGRVRWAHRSYAEFLASCYLLDREVETSAVMSLLRHPDDPDMGLVPQLYGVIGWLASMDPDIFDLVVASQPATLLSVDFDGLGSTQRERLAASMIEAVARGSVDSWSILLNSRLHRIATPGLTNVLRPWIEGGNKDHRARISAIQLARATSTPGLGDTLLTVALTPHETFQAYEIRHYAASAVGKIGNDEQRRGLRPLLDLEPADDPEDELRAAALSALWPMNELTAEELFGHLGGVQDHRYVGSYRAFLHDLDPSGFSADELGTALRWMRSRKQRGNRMHNLAWQDLDKRIVDSAWERLPEVDTLAVELSRTLQHLLETFQETSRSLFPGPRDTPGSQERRRLILNALVTDHTRLPGEIEKRFRMAWELVDTSDADWLLRRLDAAPSSLQRRAWAFLLGYALPAELDDALAQRFLEACETYPEVQRRFAGRLSQNIAQYRAAQPLHREVAVLQSRTPEELHALVLSDTREAIHAGRWASDSGRANTYWDQLEAGTQQLAVEAALDFLTNAQITELNGGVAVDGFTLLIRLDRLEAVPSSTWHRWRSVFPTRRPLLEAYASRYPDDAFTAWKEALADARAPEVHWIAGAADVVIDSSRATSFAEWAIAGELSSSVARTALQALAASPPRAPAALRIATVLRRATNPALQAVGASYILRVGDTAERAEVWPFVMAAKGLARAVAQTLAEPRESYKRVYPRWSDVECEQWFDRLVELYPPSKDPTTRGRVSNRHEIGWSRNQLITELASRGTAEGVKALTSIQQKHPELDWLKFSVEAARRTFLEQSWQAMKPNELLRRLREADSRLVRGANDLLDLVVEGLNRYQGRLKGPGDRARSDCWDTMNRAVHAAAGGTAPGDESVIARPKSENDLSGAVKRELDDFLGELTVVNREVEIASKSHSAMGERLDLDITQAGVHRATVVLEAKRVWHRDVRTSMEAQLRKRYLARDGLSHGVYLVFWFDPSKLQVTPPGFHSDFHDLERTRDFFRNHAAELTGRHDVRIEAFVLDCSTPG